MALVSSTGSKHIQLYSYAGTTHGAGFPRHRPSSWQPGGIQVQHCLHALPDNRTVLTKGVLIFALHSTTSSISCNNMYCSICSCTLPFVYHHCSWCSTWCSDDACRYSRYADAVATYHCYCVAQTTIAAVPYQSGAPASVPLLP